MTRPYIPLGCDQQGRVVPTALRVVRPIDGPLAERARLLWPDSEEMQRRWLRAVQLVRKSPKGWLLERKLEKR